MSSHSPDTLESHGRESAASADPSQEKPAPDGHAPQDPADPAGAAEGPDTDEEGYVPI